MALDIPHDGHDAPTPSIPGSEEGFWVRESLQPQSAHLPRPQVVFNFHNISGEQYNNHQISGETPNIYSGIYSFPNVSIMKSPKPQEISHQHHQTNIHTMNTMPLSLPKCAMYTIFTYKSG